jgi:dolichol-phosphate mannosyltransferase
MITVVMSALNEEKNIQKSFKRLINALILFKYKYQIILIDDGSKDNSHLILRNISIQNKKNTLFLKNKINRGIGFCLTESAKLAKYNYLLFYPSDGEIDPIQILKYKKYLFEKKDLIIPYPANQLLTRSKLRYYLSNIYQSIIRIFFLKKIKYFNGTIIFKKELIFKLNIFSRRFFIFSEIILKYLKYNKNYVEVPYLLKKRLSGKSKAVNFTNLKEVIISFIKMMKFYYL